LLHQVGLTNHFTVTLPYDHCCKANVDTWSQPINCTYQYSFMAATCGSLLWINGSELESKLIPARIHIRITLIMTSSASCTNTI